MARIVFVLLILVMQSCISVNVGSVSGKANTGFRTENPHIKATGTHFDEGVTNEHWSNSNGDNHTSATYTNYTGSTYVLLTATKALEVQFHHNAEVANGELILEIFDDAGVVYTTKEFMSDREDMFSVVFPSAGTYTVKWTGDHTDGSYYMEWRELSL